MYTYIDRFYYLAFLNKMLDLNKKYTFKLKLIEIFSYNYIAIFIYIYYFKNKNVNLRYSYIITNRYLFKYLNNIYLNVYYFVYNIEAIKKYI
jgi:hypothetical protein